MRIGLCLVAMAAGIAAMPATAKVQTVALGGVSFFDTPYTYDFGGGNTVTFTTVDKSFSFNPAGVSTGGNTQIASLGIFGPLKPTSYFFNRGGAFGPTANTAQFASYSTPAAIDYSIAESLIGLRFDLGQGYQYGYADIVGSTLKGFRFETTPDANVPFGAVPEPAAWGLMIAGFGLIGTAARTRRRTVVAA